MRIILNAVGAPTMKPLVADLKEAASKWIAYRDLYELGSSAMRDRCGEVIMGPKGPTPHKVVARVSYNGRVWDPDGKGEIDLEATPAKAAEPKTKRFKVTWKECFEMEVEAATELEAIDKAQSEAANTKGAWQENTDTVAEEVE